METRRKKWHRPPDRYRGPQPTNELDLTVEKFSTDLAGIEAPSMSEGLERQFPIKYAELGARAHRPIPLLGLICFLIALAGILLHAWE